MKTRIRYSTKGGLLFSNSYITLSNTIVIIYIVPQELTFSVMDVTDQAIIYKKKCKSLRQCKKLAKNMLVSLGVPFTSEFRRRWNN